MKTFILLSYIMCFFSTLNAQNEYKLIKEEQGIQIFAREMECHDNANGIHQLFYQLQMINTTDLHATITWNIDTWMNGTCVTCDKSKTAENTYTVELTPSETIEGSCNKSANKGLIVYIKQLQNNRSSVLSKFEIVNLKVEFHE